MRRCTPLWTCLSGPGEPLMVCPTGKEMDAVPNHRSDETSIVIVNGHGPADRVYGALTAPEQLVISSFDVEEKGAKSLEPAGVIYDAGFGDSESDYLRNLLLMCYVQLLRERLTLTVTEASS